MDRPQGDTRAAYYVQRHLDQLLEVRKWTRAGLSLERIAQLRNESTGSLVPPPSPRIPGAVEVWTHLHIDDGVLLTIEPQRARLKPEQVRALFRGVMSLYQDVLGAKK